MANDKLDRHTDPSGLMASLREASDGRPFLGSVKDVEVIVRNFAAGVLERFDEVGHGVLTPSDAAQADKDACIKMGAAFTGQTEAYTPMRNWTGKALANHLRVKMARSIQPDEDDAGVVGQAFAVLVHGIYDMLRDSGNGNDETAMKQTLESNVRGLALALVGVDGND